ncbi:Citrate transporter [Nonomuraea maritima]|uniref:Citrate transporter n=1 Tax=Nonomuraea maritima TaxID=683260 RepID=A0A1G8YF66_9ACTN|nr:SLC13 family permease [Nonomuraea maritima]SDK00680.1 Citrate transporter [Nonomuraea maritima]
MSAEVIALIVLVLVFLIATIRSINMGALALVAAFIVGTTVFGVEVGDVIGGFPGNLFVILVGVTYLFALAKTNGTVDWIVHRAVVAVRGRVALMPWVMFLVCAAITAIGAASPAAVAIVAPVAMGFAARYRINPVMMGMMVVQGATAGSFSPIGIFGAITNGVVDQNHLAGSPAVLFGGALAACALIGLVSFVSLGGRELVQRDRESARAAVAAGVPASGVPASGVPASGVPASGGGGSAGGGVQDDVLDESALRLDAQRTLTLVGLLVLAVGALVFDLDIGFLALAVAVVLTLIFPSAARGAVDKISWGTVLLVGGIVTYVTLLQDQGTVKWLGDGVAQVGAPLLAAFLICLIGAVVSAFASTTGILGALIPLAVPFLQTGQVGTIGLITALAISSSVVDCSPFSTNGALIVANSEVAIRDDVFRRLMTWGMTIMVVAPLVCWLVLVVPGGLS